MGFPIVRLPLQSSFEIFCGRPWLAKVIQHVAAVNVCRDNGGISVQDIGEVLPSLLAQSLMLVYVTLKERNIRFLGKNVVVFSRERQKVIIFSQVQQIVAKVDHYISIPREGLDRFLRDIR